MKFCKDCKFFKLEETQRHYYASPDHWWQPQQIKYYQVTSHLCTKGVIDPVTGDTLHPEPSCVWMRDDAGRCKPDGILWESK